MEHFLKCYLEHFNDVPRNTLHDRRNRKHMVEYINTLIQGCSTVDDDIQITCKEAVETLINYHEEVKNTNGSVCMMGKYHNILYVAVKLCYLWQLKDAETVCGVLRAIYACEKTFERILIGAIFSTSAPYYIAGWKSDFENQEENLRALVYFLDKSNTVKLKMAFNWGDSITIYRFIDLPIESCGKASPLKITVQLGFPDKLMILLRFGALVCNEREENSTIEQLLDKLLEFNHCYPYNLVSCLQLILRSIPCLNFSIMEKYGILVEDGLIPISRCGICPPELKHLCRCAIRQALWENYELPSGIKKLPVPELLCKYLDIFQD